MTHKINHANIKEWAKNYDGPLFDGILCDPPYELGFMGKSWDSSGIAFDVEMWQDIYKLLKPGAHLLAFSGSRTYHRMAVAIEDAGFEIRDQLIWMYGSGFPKSLNIGKSVNQLETNEWTKISKALDNVQKTDIIRVWKSNSNNVNIVAKLSQRQATVAGTHTGLNGSVLLRVVLPNSQEKQNTSADTVEIALSVHQATLTRINTALQNVVAEIKQLQEPVKFAEKSLQSQNHKHLTTSTAQENVKDTPSENMANKIRVEEALKTLRGKRKYSDEETINVLCAVLTENLLHTILSQSKTFQNLDTTSKTECASAITVTITEYMAECLTTYTVDIAKSKAVDKIQGNEREITGDNPNFRPVSGKEGYLGQSNFRQTDGMSVQTKGTSEWEGYGTALKPAIEPIILARKPISEKNIALNVLKHGTGGLNIDGTRITSQDNLGRKNNVSPYSNDRTWSVSKTPPQDNTDNPPIGRFPANLIHDGSDEVEAVFPNNNSRFFYCSKASKSERNAGLDNMPDMPMAMSNQAKAELKRGNTDFAGHKEGDWNGVKMLKNHHPTVKPLSLTKYLATLIKPPTGGRLLVPFSGSGSEMIGALQAGWEYVEGVELTEEYIPIAEARIKHWIKEPVQQELV